MVSQKLTVRATQSLVMTKHLQQSLKILQMNTLELKEYLDEKVEENPFIELPNALNEGFDGEELRYTTVGAKHTGYIDDVDYLSKLAEHNLTLKEHLLSQILIEIPDPQERLIAVRCTDSINEDGYLIEGIDELSNSLKCSKAMVQAVLNKLYKLDPAGAYAKDLKECLWLQLNDQKIHDEAYKAIIDNLELVAKGELNKLTKLCGVSEEEIKKRVNVIKKLNPKPGKPFSNETAQTLIPDAYIYFSDDKLSIKLNKNYLPVISLNSSLYNSSVESAKNPGEKEFCKSRFQEASLIYKALEQRSETIYLISKAIADEQYEFFEKGVAALKPMTLNDIAKRTGLHESTISRLNNKVLATPIGTFEMKYFFTSKLKSNYAENIYSSTSIKNSIKELIANEEEKVLADDKIAKILESQGVDISRRTVTKYREAMRLPSSHERKRLKGISVF
jgi:RNA polymerase sigma-54 factor